MEKITLSDEEIELLLVLLNIKLDSLSRTFQDNFNPKVTGLAGRVPNQFDVKLAEEMQLSIQIKRQLDLLHLTRAHR
jgi:hypothetical protein